MAMKYWRLKLKGERSADEIQSAVGQSGGNVLRIHFEGGETHVYFAAEKPATPKTAEALKGAAMPEEVSADEVTKIS
jgi:hypothetical protein